ncbi:hypothetical protein RB200_19380 [Streptomyces sp. PmtG]
MATQCKLYTNTAQLIEPETWTTVRYDVVLRDDARMSRGDGELRDPSSALIVPSRSGDFIWYRFVHWDAIEQPEGDVRQRQFMERFVRDPYGGRDSTGSADGDDTAGREFHLGGWAFYGRAGQPVAVEVWHDHHEPVAVVHAQFVGMTWDY